MHFLNSLNLKELHVSALLKSNLHVPEISLKTIRRLYIYFISAFKINLMNYLW